MKRNKVVYKFGNVLDGSVPRSKFDRSFKHTTTFNVGQLVPVFLDEVLPGDSIKITTNSIVRMTTPIKPVMDNVFVDVSYFFVPMRLVWSGTQKFFGENSDPYAVKEFPQIPQLIVPKTGIEPGTLLDYFGLPTSVKFDDLRINALPVRAYVKIFNDWFRDENMQQALHLFTDSSDRECDFASDVVISAERGGFPAMSNKYHDYYTSCLPSPQKGDAVAFNLLGGLVPVNAYPKIHDTAEPGNIMTSLRWASTKTGQTVTTDNNSITPLINANQDSSNPLGGLTTNKGSDDIANVENGLTPNNLWADLTGSLGSITVNQLRQSIALQQYLEKDSRGGTRYVEFLKTHFGVNSSDVRQQRSEYLGGVHQPIDVHTVPQTSSTDSTTPQANLSAFTATQINHNSVDKVFEEHGYIVGLATVRYEHTYQQGLNKMWSRRTRYDLYDPVFANLGEQPVYTKEIFANNETVSKNTIFGYNEAWADYRYKPNMVTGIMRSKKDGGSLDIWHYADYYAEEPVLSSTWIREDSANIDRTLAIKSTGENAQPQLIADFYFGVMSERPLPTYSVPGLKRI